VIRLCLGNVKTCDGYGVYMWISGCQVESEQRPHKVSFYVDKAKAEEVIKTLTEKFRERQVRLMSFCLFDISLMLCFCRLLIGVEIAVECQDYIQRRT
jgi:hypothetical protein